MLYNVDIRLNIRSDIRLDIKSNSDAFCYFFLTICLMVELVFLLSFLNYSIIRQTHIGMSPSGKARDFDSLSPWVRIPSSQPYARVMEQADIADLKSAGSKIP